MTKKTRPYREALLEALSDPVEAAEYLNVAIEDSPQMFLKALRNVAQARQMATVAKAAGVSRESLYKALSSQGNPTVETLRSVLAVVGLKLDVKPAKDAGVTPIPAPSPSGHANTPTAPRKAQVKRAAVSGNQLSFFEMKNAGGTSRAIGGVRSLPNPVPPMAFIEAPIGAVDSDPLALVMNANPYFFVTQQIAAQTYLETQ